MNTVITEDHKASGVVITVHGHEWEPHVPQSPGAWRAAKLPAPLDAWGAQTAWRLVSCAGGHDGSCADFTVAECSASETRRARLLQNFNIVFGVTRNKAFASAFRARKAAAAAEEEEDEEEEEDDVEEDAEDDDSSSSSEAAEESSATEEDDDDEEDDEAAEEEEEEEESSSSSDSEDAPKTKRGTKRAAPAK